MPLEGVRAQARTGALHQTIICCRNQRLGIAKRSLRSRHTEMVFKSQRTCRSVIHVVAAPKASKEPHLVGLAIAPIFPLPPPLTFESRATQGL